ncbi:MAG: hypothetical protein IPF99_17195 [Deltaproteobacteria bacterium]|nr:hypothetical protein [Deltaproteobacteria bacterium]
MIPVQKAAAPTDFDERVRRPGLDAIAELVGETRQKPRGGKKRSEFFSRREKIPGEKFPPYWRRVLPEMLTSYGRRCAYLALYIERATGSPTVDHVLPKSKRWDRVYEWDNYRLACSQMNSIKGDLETVLDPFNIGDDWFALEFVAFQVKPGPGATDQIQKAMPKTLELLNLPEFCEARREYVEDYLAGEITLSRLTERAPFIARELRRQDKLLPADTSL